MRERLIEPVAHGIDHLGRGRPTAEIRRAQGWIGSHVFYGWAQE
jgi:hypothetical protein